MWSERLRESTQGIRASVGRFLGRLGVSPNALTVLGYLLHVPAAYSLARGQFTLGGVLFLVASLLDSLDGSVAREMGWVTPFGAFLDSVTDRFSEAAVLPGLARW